MSNFITISIPNTTGIKFGINVDTRILYYTSQESTEWTELTTPDILSQALVGPAAANKLIITNNIGDNVELINFRLDETYSAEDFPRANALPVERVIRDFVNDVISNYFTKLEIESTYTPLPIEITDDESYGTVEMDMVSGGVIYTYNKPISKLTINQIESSSQKTKININVFSDKLYISVPNNIEILNSVPPENIIKYVITIENNQLGIDYITLPNNIRPSVGQTGYWIYNSSNVVVSSGLFYKDLSIPSSYRTRVYNYGRLENISSMRIKCFYVYL